ncbi:hypothetical protein HanRHA438_Chr09g0429281 [Helianthus annuus]|nr:hypothetical protein HanHA300_Chr09g0342981 [Helianthus annuus]KAJ0537153.1 hypothetical protein HanIR_Chr09g0449551 [Helianthus annuus]KAJ0544671.1 hypothetical protein HanHA89_Chr09g0364221 [Helianthus annuus]KAJ0709674.1 hypothetical protein HanLR1_Chr09g0342941 [Helianthus annuus]KAJ0713547.1 hypothetical protein HanOQP8_Chr09g0347041 [Helianthus annuus]
MIPDELGSRLASYMDPYTYGQSERVIPRGVGAPRCGPKTITRELDDSWW